MNVSPVIELLRQLIGLNPESIGSASLEKTVRECIEASGATSIEEYLKQVTRASALQKQLIESVVIIETSFFRNTTPFLTLKKYLKQFVLDKRGHSLRILCLPCSTGEEAYSIAMALFDMKLSPQQFFIFAADISEHALQLARAGQYSAYSFRGEDISFRKKYFSRQVDGTYLLKDEVRDVVKFEWANILSDNFLAGHQPYDVIFCRNLLIYFDEAAKAKAMQALSAHLAEDGILFMGHAEGSHIQQFGFANLAYPMSFAFARKKYAKQINDELNATHDGKTHPPPAPAKSKVAKPVPKFEAASGQKKPVPPGQNRETESVTKQRRVELDITTAKQLAEQERFSEVAAVCEKLLSEGVESAQVYYLMGQAAAATGDNLLAEEYLSKAIYLNADYHDALIDLSKLFSRMGNPDKAASFRRRAQRVKSRKERDAAL